MTKKRGKIKKRRLIPEEQRRQEILEAAAQVFSKKGYHGATVSDIAAKANVGHGTVYRFFRSKRALATEVIGAMGASGFIESLGNENVKGIEPEELLKTIGKKYFGNLENRLPVIRFAISEAVTNKALANYYYENPLHRLFLHLSDFISEYQGKGIFRKGNPFILGHIFYGMLFGFLYSQELMWGKEKDRLDPNEIIDSIVDVFLNGIKAPD